MIRRLALAALITALPIGGAWAANCSSNPFTLTNGQLADATQVMSNFNNLLNCANNNLAHNGANTDITSLLGLTTPLPTSEGGTGLGSLTAGTLLLGNGASAITLLAPSTQSNLVVSSGGTFVSAIPPLTSGNVLVSDGTNWKADLGPGPVLIQTQTVSNTAAVTFTTGFTSIYDEMLIVYSNLIPVTNSVNFQLRISEDGGATYKAGATNYKWTQFTTADNGTNSSAGSTADSSIHVGQGLANTNVGAGEIRIWNHSSSTVGKNVQTSYNEFTGANFSSNFGGGIYTPDTAPITAIQLLMSTGNISTGTISLYGVRK